MGWVQELILNSLNDIPFLENACCNETKNCFNYFVDKEPLILQRNNEIKDINFKILKLVNPVNLKILSSFFSDILKKKN